MLRYALVCDSAVVGPSATVSAGAVISHNVVIGSGHTVAPHARVSLCSQVQQEVSRRVGDVYVLHYTCVLLCVSHPL